MSDKPKSGYCVICTVYCNALNWHHTVPVALGGESSLQIPLCPTCHDTLHAHAEAIVAKIRTGRKIKRIFWKTSLEENNSKVYIEILVGSILSPPIAPEDKEIKVMAKLDVNLHRGLQLIKIDNALGNLETALKYCIAYTLKNKGVENGNDKRASKESQDTKITKASLW
jgi:hypothetical protein